MGATQTYQFDYLPLGLCFCYEFSGKNGSKNKVSVLLNTPDWLKKCMSVFCTSFAYFKLDQKKINLGFRYVIKRVKKEKNHLSNREKKFSKKEVNAIYKDNLPLTLFL